MDDEMGRAVTPVYQKLLNVNNQCFIAYIFFGTIRVILNVTDSVVENPFTIG